MHGDGTDMGTAIQTLVPSFLSTGIAEGARRKLGPHAARSMQARASVVQEALRMNRGEEELPEAPEMKKTVDRAAVHLVSTSSVCGGLLVALALTSTPSDAIGQVTLDSSGPFVPLILTSTSSSAAPREPAAATSGSRVRVQLSEPGATWRTGRLMEVTPDSLLLLSPNGLDRLTVAHTDVARA